MSFSESRLQMPIGARSSKFWPITAEPVNAHPTYAPSIGKSLTLVRESY